MLETFSSRPWITLNNPLFVAYQAYTSGNSRSAFLPCLRGCAVNAIKAVGEVFASIPEVIWNFKKPSVHWARAKIYSELALICFKALWNYRPTMEQMREMEARSCFLDFLDPTRLTTDLFDSQTPPRNADQSIQYLSVLFNQMTELYQKRFLSFLEQKTCPMPSAGTETKVIEFLATCPENLAAPIIKKILLYQATTLGRVLINFSDGSRQFMRKETLEKGVPYLFAQDQFTPPLVEAAKNHYAEGVRFIEKKEQSRALLEGLNKVYVSSEGIWDSFHHTLAADLAFLVRVTPAQKADKVRQFLTFACQEWCNKILTGIPLNETQFPLVADLCNRFEHSQLRNTFLLYLLTKFSELPPDWIAGILLCKDELIRLLFSQEKISPTHAFIKLLTLFLQKKHAKDIIELCKLASKNVARFEPVNERKLEALRKEFNAAFEKFPLTKHLDLCLTLYKESPKDNQGQDLLPILRSKIPEIAHEVANKRGESPPPECEEILTLSLHTDHPKIEDRHEQYFAWLQLGMKQQMGQLKQACFRKILEFESYLMKNLSAKRVAAFVEALQAHEPPDTDLSKLLQEGISLFKFAKSIQKKHANEHASCIDYLKKNKRYLEAAKKDSSPEAKELVNLYK